MAQSDGRRDLAKSIPIAEVALRLGLEGMRAAGREQVGPCPVCGGRDRFSINPDLGLFNCRSANGGCGVGGDGLGLVQHVQACDFKAALDFLVGGADIAVDPAEVERRRAASLAAEARRNEIAETRRGQAIRDAREIWHAASHGSAYLQLAEQYFAGRGIQFPLGLPPTIRVIADHPCIKFIAGEAVELHRGPALISAIQAPDNMVRAVHQTWFDPERPGSKASIIAPDGEVMPSKMVRGSKKGNVIRLSPRRGATLVMGEGIETTASAVTVRALPNATYWSGVDLGNMAGRQLRVQGSRWSGVPDLGDERAFVPPDWVERLVLIQDGDSHPAATRAALLSCIRRAMHFRPNLIGQIVSAGDGRDLNDVLQNSEADHGGE